MTIAQWIVTGAGLAAVAWVQWYFLWSRRRVPAPAAAGVQEVRVVVKGGYDPDTIVVRAGAPVRLQFYREETADCSDRVVLAAFGIERELPAFETATIEFTPTEAGEYPFHCATQALRGLLIVEPAGSDRRAASSPHRFHG